MSMTYEEFLDLAHERSIMSVFRASDGGLSLGQSSRQEYLSAMKQAEEDLWRADGVVRGDEISVWTYWKYRGWDLWSNEELLHSPHNEILMDVEWEIARNVSPPAARKEAIESYWDKWENVDD